MKQPQPPLVLLPPTGGTATITVKHIPCKCIVLACYKISSSQHLCRALDSRVGLLCGNMCCCRQRGVYVIYATAARGRINGAALRQLAALCHWSWSRKINGAAEVGCRHSRWRCQHMFSTLNKSCLLFQLYSALFCTRPHKKKLVLQQVWRTFATETEIERGGCDTRDNTWSCPVEWTPNVCFLYIYFYCALDSKQCRRFYISTWVSIYIYSPCDYLSAVISIIRMTKDCQRQR